MIFAKDADIGREVAKAAKASDAGQVLDRCEWRWAGWEDLAKTDGLFVIIHAGALEHEMTARAVFRTGPALMFTMLTRMTSDLEDNRFFEQNVSLYDQLVYEVTDIRSGASLRYRPMTIEQDSRFIQTQLQNHQRLVMQSLFTYWD